MIDSKSRAAVKICISSIFALVVVGCSSSNENIHSVSYYRQHDQERAAKLELCKNNPGQDTLNSNCQNATKADGLEAASNSGTIQMNESELKSDSNENNEKSQSGGGTIQMNNSDLNS